MKRPLLPTMAIPGTVLALGLAACSASEPSPQTSQPAASAQETSSMTSEPAARDAQDLYALQVRSLEGEPVDLSRYRGKVALVVNVASRCGYTPQYAGLQELYSELKDRGLVVLGFPCNDFGGQEPGSAEEIRAFCSDRYQVSFPMFEKVQTRSGAGQSEVYGLLGEAAGELPRWNFGKYLVGRDGRLLAYFDSNVSPESGTLREAVIAALDS